MRVFAFGSHVIRMVPSWVVPTLGSTPNMSVILLGSAGNTPVASCIADGRTPSPPRAASAASSACAAARRASAASSAWAATQIAAPAPPGTTGSAVDAASAARAAQVQGALGFCQTAAALRARLPRSHAVSPQCPGGSVDVRGVFSASAARFRSWGSAGPLPARCHPSPSTAVGGGLVGRRGSDCYRMIRQYLAGGQMLFGSGARGLADAVPTHPV
jgi:hypothetical protein